MKQNKIKLIKTKQNKQTNKKIRYVNAVERLQTESNIFLNKVAPADNVDLMMILQVNLIILKKKKVFFFFFFIFFFFFLIFYKDINTVLSETVMD